MRTFIGSTLLFAISILAGCSTDHVCAPGATQECLCVDAPRGVQACSSDGARWETCACSKSANATAQPVVRGAATPEPVAVMQGVVPQPSIPEPAIGAQPYKITIISANLAPSKPDGRAWDVGNGPPDAVVSVAVKGVGTGHFSTSKKQDSTAPVWREAGQVTLNRGDHLSISIIDKDLADDDPIASWDLEFLRPGHQRLTAPDNSVNELLLDIEAAAE